MRFAAVTVAAVLSLSCGSEGQPQATAAPTPTPSPLTKAEWVQRANAACKAQQERMASIPEPKTAADFLSVLRRLISEIERVQSELRALPPPEADRLKIEQWLEGNDQQIAALKRGLPAVEEAAKTGDAEAAGEAYSPAIGAFGGIAATQEEFARSYGLSTCAA